MKTTLDEDEEEYITDGYTRYGEWYGDLYGEWCAMFVSFYLNYANISDEMIPYDDNCKSWVESLTDEDFFVPTYIEMEDEDGKTILIRNEYTLEAGNLIFFDTDENVIADHVGIVEELEIEEE